MNACKIALLSVVGLLALWLPADARTVAVFVNSAPVAWGDSRIEEKLCRLLTRESGVRVIVPDEMGQRFIASCGDPETDGRLMAWGKEHEVAHILVVTVLGEKLERRKGFSVPLLFHKWETVGTVEAEVRLFSVMKGKWLVAQPVLAELKGPRAIQATMDDNQDDPDLRVRAHEKQKFLSTLEDQFCDTVVALTRPYMRMAERVYYSQQQEKR